MDGDAGCSFSDSGGSAMEGESVSRGEWVGSAMKGGPVSR